MPLNLNPMNISGPTQPAPYQQPNTANPAANNAVASYSVGADELGLTQPITRYVQPGINTPNNGTFPF
jgi:hypothetical protein